MHSETLSRNKKERKVGGEEKEKGKKNVGSFWRSPQVLHWRCRVTRETWQGCWLPPFDAGRESADYPHISKLSAHVIQCSRLRLDRRGVNPKKQTGPWPLLCVPRGLVTCWASCRPAYFASGSRAAAGSCPFSNICFETRCLQVSHSQGS